MFFVHDFILFFNQAKFIPFSDDCKIVSCARDGQVRLAELHPDGSLRCTKKLAQHSASAHKVLYLNKRLFSS